MDSLETLERELRANAATMVHSGKPSPAVAEHLACVRHVLQAWQEAGLAPEPCLALPAPDRSVSFHAVHAEGHRLGRHPDNDLVLDFPSVSGYHCRVSLQRGEWIVEDTGSKNGVYLRGSRIQSGSLRDGDIIHLGEARLVFLAGQA